MRVITMVLGLLFIALCHPSLAQSVDAGVSGAPAAAPAPAAPTTVPSVVIDDWQDVLYELHRPFELSCKPSSEAETQPGDFAWKANGTDVGQVGSLKGRFELKDGGATFAVARSMEEDWGNYTCAVRSTPARGFVVSAKPLLRLPPNSNVVEGQKLKLTCRVVGRPYPAVRWTYAPVGENETHVDALEFLEGRGKVQDSAAGVPGGELLLEGALRTDAGNFSCGAEGALSAYTTLRVKDMYAALWPFLGICAEVFILCAIILVYEKRRTKPELDDSDTDNHDQKKS